MYVPFFPNSAKRSEQEFLRGVFAYTILDRLHGKAGCTRLTEKREKRKRKVGNEAGEYIPNSLSERIISEARKQVCDIDLEDESGTVEESKRMRHVSLGVSNEETSDAESFTCDDGYDDQVIELDPKDEADLQRFMTNKEGVARTLYDIIKTKIDAKTDDAGFALSVADPMEFNMRDLDPEIVEMYKEIGKVLSKYRSGKIPKAFKVIPKMVNWEQILYLTDPDGWSAAAMYQATRLFASNLNPRMCQRFYNLVLLPRIRDDIDEFKKLNFHLYQALCKAVYKPAAFFKGIILPLCEITVFLQVDFTPAIQNICRQVTTIFRIVNGPAVGE
ncbi:hypothetical protein RB195_010061 [Necator americanus]|uniref:Bystin n=1 Tax=Necator americanus TaxID=51031 RepID=A0ABR1CW94_NECAM